MDWGQVSSHSKHKGIDHCLNGILQVFASLCLCDLFFVFSSLTEFCFLERPLKTDLDSP